MGLLDTLLGRSKPVRANLDALFALPSAAVTLETSIGLVFTGKAGVCWKPPAGRPAEDVQREIAALLEIPDEDQPDTGATPTAEAATPAPGVGALTTAEDGFGYRWLLLEDADVEQLVTRVHVINSTLTDDGWGPQLLCSVFGLTPGPDAEQGTPPFFFVYLYKRGTFYPFAPDGKEHRNSEFELRVRGVLGADLPIEPDVSRWFPLWDMPLR